MQGSARPPLRLPGGVYYGWAIVAVSFAVNVVASPMNPLILSFFLPPMTSDMGWSRSDLGWALTLRMAGSGVALPLLGRMVDRHGTRWLGVGASLLAGATLAGLALAHDLWLLYLLFFLSGLAGMSGPGGALLTAVPAAKWFVRKRGRALAITAAGLGFGTTLAIPLTQLLISAVGWRAAWVVFGVAIWAVAVPLFAIFMRREPEDVGLYPDGAPAPASRLAAPASAVTSPAGDLSLREAVRTPVLWLILGAQIVLQFTVSGTLLHRTSFWQLQGLSPALVAVGTAVDPFMVIFAALAFGFLGERLKVRYLGMLGGLFWATCMLPMLLYQEGHAYFIFLHNFIWALAAGANINFQNLVWPSYYGRRYLGTIRGVLLPLSMAAGALGAPLYGYLIDHGGGYGMAWALSLVGMAGAGAAYLFARPPRRAATAEPATAPAGGRPTA